MSRNTRWDILGGGEQNPSPGSGLEFERAKQELTDKIVAAYIKALPSNYVSLEKGPWYTLQFQAIAEQLAEFQLVAQDVFKDGDWDFTRPDYLFQILGKMVFPNATSRKGYPTVTGDVSQREFLKGMVLLLLQGATASAAEDGVGLLGPDITATVVERFLSTSPYSEAGGWTIDNQFEIEVFVEVEDGTQFSSDPATLQKNAALVLEALKPAHVMYGYSHLFREAFGTLFDDEASWQMEQYFYDDLRKNCYGAKEITGTTGETLTDRTLFTDTTKSFANVYVGATLRLDSGDNEGTWTVTDVRAFIYGDDATARAYTTSPTGLSGMATVSDEVITDTSQDFGSAVEGEVLTFTSGFNAGSYRLETLLGPTGGPVGVSAGPATGVRVSQSILRLTRRMVAAATGQTYVVEVDRLGVRTPQTKTAEDASEQFYL